MQKKQGHWLYFSLIRKPIFFLFLSIFRILSPSQRTVPWKHIQHQRLLIFQAVLATLDRLLQKRQIAPHVLNRIIHLWGLTVLRIFTKNPQKSEFEKTNACKPPWFLVISPGGACNLKCKGCYADSGVEKSILSWSVLDRLVTEAKQYWGVPLFVFSGGEPLLYTSEGKDLLALVEKHCDSLFLMFTNGTLIDEVMAKRMAQLGNITPALSVEGMQAETEYRRGAGVFNKIISAMQALRQAGVPFGISIMVTRLNINLVLQDKLLDFYFNHQGAFYGFIFQYMPIGRDAEIHLIPQGKELEIFWQRSWDVIEKKGIFLLDFWNHGPLVEGCIAAGRENGYFYVDWDGKVMPCVFAPYTPVNLYDVYAQGGNINKIWANPFFEKIRSWQVEYGYGSQKTGTCKNWLHACPFRDHHSDFMEWVGSSRAQSADCSLESDNAKEALATCLNSISSQNFAIREGIWNKEYLNIHRDK